MFFDLLIQKILRKAEVKIIIKKGRFKGGDVKQKKKMKKTTVFSIFGVINSQVVKEADELIADELVEMNRHAKFCYTTTEIAKRYGMKGNDLLSFLRDRKVVMKHSGDYCVTSRYQNMDLISYRYSIRYSQQGKRLLKRSMVWTEKGREFINELLYN